MDSEILGRHQFVNRLQSALIMAAMAGLLGLLGYLLGGLTLMVLSVLGGMALLAFAPRIPTRLLLGMYRARPLAPHEAPQLFALVDELATRAELARSPALYYVPSRMLNAFTVGGREHAAIALSDGLLRAMGWRELAGVLAHELSHVRHNDVWVMGLADLFSRMTSLLSTFGLLVLLFYLPLMVFTPTPVPWLAVLLLIFAPTLAALLQLALSRQREYHADAEAVAITGDPHGLAAALTRLEHVQGGWLERIFLPGRRLPEPSLLRTHPPTQARIERLLSMAPSAPVAARAASAHVIGQHLPAITRRPRWHVLGNWYSVF